MSLLPLASALIVLGVPQNSAIQVNVNAKTGDTVSGTQTFRVTVDSSSAIQQVEFYIGDPLADVGYLCAMWAQDDDPDGLLKLSRATTEPGYPTREGLAERYAERSERSLREIRWYTTLALWKFCVIMEGNYRRALRGATDNPFVREFGAEVPAIAAFAEARARVGNESS